MNGAKIDYLKNENKKLKEELTRYKLLVEQALTDYQNKEIIEDRKKKAVEEIKKLEKETRSIAQKIRREQEKQDKLKDQLEQCKDKLVNRWKGF